MRQILAILLLITTIHSSAQNIIPEPVNVKKGNGIYRLPAVPVIEADPSWTYLRQTLTNKFMSATGKNISYSTGTKANIKFIINKIFIKDLGSEGYTLDVTPGGVEIKANEAAGLYYGAQTLFQLMPPAIENRKGMRTESWEIPVLSITDYPRFAWRGLMFDVSRHFFTKDEVKRFIDDMVKYKFNLLHLHLSDDEGWRIEIKGLPKLTEVGAWRADKTGYFGTFTPPLPDEPKTYGGFFTQDDIRELVKYAKENYVNILPEIDVPGHSLAAVVSYPELSCTADAVNYKVRSGEQIMDWSHGAPPIALVDNTLCPANERVYTFLDTVITQLAALFPFEYIHLGGDECPKNFWEKTPAILDLMKREKLKNMEEVQAYFEKRVEKIVLAKGKKFIGWDEILEGGLAPSAAVMSWRGMQGGIDAAKMGHEVVMSPTTFAYLDYMQGDLAIEPRVYASLSLKKSYQFEPLPAGVRKELIKGGQANLWTEQIYNMRTVQYMLWPRALAVAESVWSQPEKKVWSNFFSRVENQFPRLDSAETKYSRATYDPLITAKRNDAKQVEVTLTSDVDGLDLYYSFDNSFPDRYYPKYTTPVIVPKDAFQMKVISYRGTKPVGRMMVITTEELRNRADKKK